MATLTGGQETPPNASTATGAGTFVLQSDNTTLNYTVTHNVSGGTASHIHAAPGAQSGAVIVGLTPFSTNMTGTVTLTAQDVANLQAGRLYVNVHSGTFPGGEIRGQLLKPGETLFTSIMTGANEVPPVSPAGNGVFALILSTDKTSVSGEGLAQAMTSAVSASHIHAAAAGVNGGVAYTIVHTDTGNDAGLSLAATAINATDLTNLLATGWYTNVHTANNGGGEIRGQLTQQ